MDEHDQRRSPRHALQLTGTLGIAEHIEPWELEMLLKMLASPGTASPATPETHDGE